MITSLRGTRETFSAVSRFLTIPSSAIKSSGGKGKGKGKAGSGARVLTSEESLAIMEEKEHLKKEEEDAKERRKLEREEKRQAKEVEKKLKAEEREKKAEERRKKAELKKQEQEEKRQQREAKNKHKQSGVPKPNEHSGNETGIQTNEITNSECAACFGLYEDDLLPDGELVEEWVECTGCKKWMHGQCVRLDDQELMACCLCGTVFQ